MSRRTFTWNAYESGLTTGLGIGASSVEVDSVVGLVAPGYLVIDPDVPDKREWIRFESITGNTLETLTRNLDGSVGDIAHDAGARIRAIFTKQNLDDIFLDILDNTQDLIDHVGAADPHPDYLTQGEGDARYLKLAADNDPLTGSLNLGQFELTGAQNISNDGSVRIVIGSGSAAVELRANDGTAHLLVDDAGPRLGALPLDANAQQLKNLLDPTDPQDAVTLDYFDNNVTLDHNGLTGVTADQHHAQVHAIDGPDHTGTLDTVYLRLDAANDPMQANLDMGGFDLVNVDEVQAGDGNSGDPAYTFTSDQTKGLYLQAGIPTFVGDVKVGEVTGRPLIRDKNSYGEPGFTFIGDTDLGLYRFNSNVLGMALAGTAPAGFLFETSGVQTRLWFRRDKASSDFWSFDNTTNTFVCIINGTGELFISPNRTVIDSREVVLNDLTSGNSLSTVLSFNSGGDKRIYTRTIAANLDAVVTELVNWLNANEGAGISALTY